MNNLIIAFRVWIDATIYIMKHWRDKGYMLTISFKENES